MAMMPSQTVCVAGTLDGIRAATDACDRFLAAHDLDRETGWPVQVALDEILANIVGHAYKGRSDGVIEMTFALTGSMLVVTIADDGPAVDPLALPTPDVGAPLQDRRPGGLGIHLVKQLMHRVEYSRKDDRNCLVLMRQLPGQAPDEPGKG
jgi:serine/threonine-protein kinase RsbW